MLRRVIFPARVCGLPSSSDSSVAHTSHVRPVSGMTFFVRVIMTLMNAGRTFNCRADHPSMATRTPQNPVRDLPRRDTAQRADHRTGGQTTFGEEMNSVGTDTPRDGEGDRDGAAAPPA